MKAIDPTPYQETSEIQQGNHTWVVPKYAFLTKSKENSSIGITEILDHKILEGFKRPNCVTWYNTSEKLPFELQIGLNKTSKEAEARRYQRNQAMGTLASLIIGVILYATTLAIIPTAIFTILLLVIAYIFIGVTNETNPLEQILEFTPPPLPNEIEEALNNLALETNFDKIWRVYPVKNQWRLFNNEFDQWKAKPNQNPKPIPFTILGEKAGRIFHLGEYKPNEDNNLTVQSTVPAAQTPALAPLHLVLNTLDEVCKQTRTQNHEVKSALRKEIKEICQSQGIPATEETINQAIRTTYHE